MYVILCVCLISLSIMFLKFIHLVAYISTSFLFVAEEKSIVLSYHMVLDGRNVGISNETGSSLRKAPPGMASEPQRQADLLDRAGVHAQDATL